MQAVYQIPTDGDSPTESLALALQRVFYHLQTSSLPVGTTELTKSFGWKSLDSFMQHDVQEFSRILQDKLEIKMKGTPAEGAVQALFKGTMKNYIKCMNVDFESSGHEDFYGASPSAVDEPGLTYRYPTYYQRPKRPSIIVQRVYPGRDARWRKQVHGRRTRSTGRQEGSFIHLFPPCPTSPTPSIRIRL